MGAAVVLVVGALLIGVGSRRQQQDHSAARLASVERKLDLVIKHLGIVEPQPDHPDIVQLLMQGKKIHAIKIYRERTGAGLAEAKHAVEDIARSRGLDAR